MPEIELTQRMYLNFNGSDASEEVMDSVISIEVDDSLTLPDMFSIHLRDSNLRWIDADSFSLGSAVEVSARDNGSEIKLITGEVTGIEPRFDATSGPSIVLRGYDKSHRLNRGRKTTSFVQMTDSDIANKIAQGAGLRAQVDTTRQVHEYVLQDNKTDWEFLVSRALRIGYTVYVRGDTLSFVETAAGDQTPTVEWAEDLIEFNARMSTMRQVSEVVVQGWDPENQQQIIGSATQARDVPQIGQSDQGGESAEQVFGAVKEIIVNRPVATQTEADALAQSICSEIGQGFIEAECVCLGNPAVQAGVVVDMIGIGNRFSGSYRVTHARHVYNSQQGYKTEFSVGGRHTSTLSELLLARSGAGSSPCPVLGVVTNNQDPQDQGRVRVRVPSISDGQELAWARLVAPGAGADRGMQWIPEVGDEVLVLFEHEEIHRPLVVGGLWSGQNKGPSPSSECLGSQGEVNVRQLVSRTGMKVAMSDDAGDQWALLSNADESLCVKVSETDSKVEIVSIGDVEISTTGDVKITAQGNVSVEGMEVALKGNSKVSIQGAQVEIKADATLDISGAMINSEASATHVIKGGLVQIN